MKHKYLNVCTPVTGTDNITRFPRIGVAFHGKEGGTAIMNVKLDALPVNGELVFFAPKASDDDVVE